MPDRVDAWPALAAAIAAWYRAEARRGVAGAAVLGDAADALDGCGLPDPSRASAARIPVCRHLPDCLTAAAGSPLASIAGAFAAIAPATGWLQNPNYTAANAGRDFLDGYGYVEPFGPGRVCRSNEFRVGFLLLGPDVHYRAHAHAAEEVYHVVSGTAEWWRDGTEWRTEPPGAGIHHAPHIRHATRTGAEPLLALYCWGGEIAAHAALVTQEAGP